MNMKIDDPKVAKIIELAKPLADYLRESPMHEPWVRVHADSISMGTMAFSFNTADIQYEISITKK